MGVSSSKHIPFRTASTSRDSSVSRDLILDHPLMSNSQALDLGKIPTNERNHVIQGIPKSTSCAICYHIYQACHTPLEEKYEASSRKVRELLKLKCKVHRKLFKAAKVDNTTMKVSVENSRASTLFIRCTYPSPSGLSTTCTEEFLLLKRYNEGVTHARYTQQGLLIDSKWIDPGLMRKWYETCRDQHEFCYCSSPMRASLLATPRYLVDTKDNCIIVAAPSSKYVALSYIWGGVECLQAEQGNLEQLTKPGALLRLYSKQIPKTIIDAMEVVRLAGERYLWVDALCIIQDEDEESKKKCLEDMGAIYSNACFTIEAVSEVDADKGLRGIRSSPVAAPRFCSQEFVKFGKDKFLIPFSVWHKRGVHFPEDTPYAARAWTFQEDLFSRRVLKFSTKHGNSTISWHCNQARWGEDNGNLGANELSPTWVEDQFGFTSGLPDLRTYLYLAKDFNCTALTYPEDRLSAFAGIMKVLGTIFYGGFVCGLPRILFDLSLLWQPSSYQSGSRRVASSGTPSSMGSVLPSWSWVGWDGAINFSSCLGDGKDENLTWGSKKNILSTVRWYVSDCPHPSPKELHAICPMNYLSPYESSSDTESLPSGWQCVSHSPLAKHDKESLGYVTHVFTYRDIRERFSYPYPFGRQLQVPQLLFSPYLHGVVERLWLYSDGVVKRTKSEMEDWESLGVPYVYLHTENLAFGGVLQVQTDTDSKGEEYWGQKSPTNNNYRMELIAISLSTPPLPTTTAELNPLRGRKGWHIGEFYNVLWIQWEDGIAYRKALGKVSRDIWESHEKEKIEIILG